MNFLNIEPGQELDLANLLLDSAVNNCYSKYEVNLALGEIRLSDSAQLSLSDIASSKFYDLPAEVVIIQLGQSTDKAFFYAILVVENIEDFIFELKELSQRASIAIKTERKINEIESNKNIGSMNSRLVILSEFVTLITLRSKNFKGSWDTREFKEGNIVNFPSNLTVS